MFILYVMILFRSEKDSVFRLFVDTWAVVQRAVDGAERDAADSCQILDSNSFAHGGIPFGSEFCHKALYHLKRKKSSKTDAVPDCKLPAGSLHLLSETGRPEARDRFSIECADEACRCCFAQTLIGGFVKAAKFPMKIRNRLDMVSKKEYNISGGRARTRSRK